MKKQTPSRLKTAKKLRIKIAKENYEKKIKEQNRSLALEITKEKADGTQEEFNEAMDKALQLN